MMMNWIIKKRTAYCIAIFALGFGLGTGPLWALERDAEHPGYLSSIKDEKYLRVYEVIVVAEPNTNKIPLSKVIFDGELSGEFQERYEQSFGRTSVDRNVDAPNRFSEAQYSSGIRVTVEDDVRKKRKFGEYMMKRLTEHHMDGYIKTNPSARPLYEIKQTVSNMSVKVNKGYKLKLNYSFSGNFVNMGLENPYDLYNRVTIKMKEGSVGPSKVEDAILNLRYPLTKTVSLESDYGLESQFVRLVGKKRLTDSVQASLSGTSNEVNDESEEGDKRDNRILIGFTWSE